MTGGDGVQGEKLAAGIPSLSEVLQAATYCDDHRALDLVHLPTTNSFLIATSESGPVHRHAPGL